MIFTAQMIGSKSYTVKQRWHIFKLHTSAVSSVAKSIIFPQNRLLFILFPQVVFFSLRVEANHPLPPVMRVSLVTLILIASFPRNTICLWFGYLSSNWAEFVIQTWQPWLFPAPADWNLWECKQIAFQVLQTSLTRTKTRSVFWLLFCQVSFRGTTLKRASETKSKHYSQHYAPVC